MLVKTAYCGICGSDMMELTLAGAPDNPLRSFISFPQIMGHEPAGTIERVGQKSQPGKDRRPGGDQPLAVLQAARHYALSARAARPGIIRIARISSAAGMPPGMHLGVATGFGGFAPYLRGARVAMLCIPGRE